MKLEKRQLELQEAMLLRLYERCTIEQAKNKEIKQKYCIITMTTCDQYIGEGGQECDGDEYEVTLYMGSKGYTVEDDYDVQDDIKDGYNDDYESFFNIIGLPPTLSRVLSALGDKYLLFEYGIYIKERSLEFEYDTNILLEDLITKVCDRKLLNEDKSDATLWDQSEETQRAIYDIIVGKGS